MGGVAVHGWASDDGARKGYKPAIATLKSTDKITGFHRQNHRLSPYITGWGPPICGLRLHPSFFPHRQITPHIDVSKGGSWRGGPGAGCTPQKKITG